MNVNKLFWGAVLSLFFCFPVFLISMIEGAPERRTGGEFPGEQTCATADCHGGQVNIGGGSVSLSINGGAPSEYRYTPGETVPVMVTVQDPDQARWGFQITARDSSGCNSVGSFVPAEGSVSVRQSEETPPVACEDTQVEYATHSFPKGGGSSATFMLNWTAPDPAVGPVTFAAAGNAANGDNAETGDLIYTTSVTVPGPEIPQPTVNQGGVVMANLLPTIRTISANSIISAFGTRFAADGTVRLLRGSDLVDNKVPTNLGNTCLEIDGERSPVFFYVPTQMNAQAPAIESLGPVSVVAIAGCGTPEESRSDPVMVTVEEFTPAFFVKPPAGSAVLDGSGVNPIAALHGGGPAEVNADAPAAPNEFISLFATGFGPTDPPLAAGEIPSRVNPDNPIFPLANGVEVSIGGIPLVGGDIFFVGAAPCCAGLNQLVVRVPGELGDGNHEVVATIGGVSTRPGPFIPVAAAAALAGE